MTKKITDLEGRLDAAMKRADKMDFTVSMTRAELQEALKNAHKHIESLRRELDEARRIMDRALTTGAELFTAAKEAYHELNAHDRPETLAEKLLSRAISSVDKSVTNPSK